MRMHHDSIAKRSRAFYAPFSSLFSSFLRVDVKIATRCVAREDEWKRKRAKRAPSAVQADVAPFLVRGFLFRLVGRPRPRPRPFCSPRYFLLPPITKKQVTASASFSGDLGLDSLDAVELVMALEEEFGIEIPDAEADKLSSTAEAISYLAAHPQAK